MLLLAVYCPGAVRHFASAAAVTVEDDNIAAAPAVRRMCLSVGLQQKVKTVRAIFHNYYFPQTNIQAVANLVVGRRKAALSEQAKDLLFINNN